MARAKRTSAATIHEALRLRFAAPEWAYLDEVRNGTGYARREVRTTADALAMSLWPSRGLELHGIEIKSDRADWLREKSAPEKADAIGRYCDRWWLAIGDASVAPLDEVPAPWGLLVFEDGGLRCARLPELLPSPLPIDRLLLAALLRKAAADVEAHAQAAIDAAREDARGAALAQYQREIVGHEMLTKALADFERVSGVRVSVYDGERIGAAVRAVLRQGPGGLRTQMEHALGQARRIVAQIESGISALERGETDEDMD